MSKLMSAVSVSFLALIFLCALAYAQAPTGIIIGTVTDESGAIVPNVSVSVTNKATGFTRTITTNAEGLYSVPALPAGEYEVRVEAQGFRTTVRTAIVQTGESTTVNLPMQVGGTKDVVTVEAATAQINYETHNIQGVIERENIESLPLNGRSYMQLASLEPGVTIANGSTAQFNALFTVSVLGAGNRTAFSIDGGNVSDNIDTGSGISSMNFSQELVQEFQLSSVNFDLATPITPGGAINVVTRTGSNDLHCSGYFYYRDHNMAAYPALQRVPFAPNPFFARRNPGFWFGGPIVKDRLFFFFSYEHTNQVQALPVQGNVPSLAQLSGIFGSPYVGTLISTRFDYRISAKNQLFLRYSHDGNTGFGDVFSNGDPSNWVHNINWADQSIIGVTSVLAPSVVNDARFQYQYWSNHNLQSTPSECQLPCVGGTLPALLTVLGTNFGFGNAAIGPNVNAPQARNTRRYQLNDSLNWQKGTHRFKFGGDMTRSRSAGLWGFCTPLCEGVYSPEFVKATLVPVLGQATFNALFPKLPSVLTSDADFLNLPFLSLASGIFTGIGVGSVSTPAPYDHNQNLTQSQYRLYFQDTWKIRDRFTFNYGLAYNAQVCWYNSDLRKPQFLAPIFGAGNLGATPNNLREFSPAIGFAWSPFKNNKTVIRGGGGIYWDGTPGYYKLREPALIGPVGDGRSTLSSQAFTNIFPGIIDFSAGGAPLAVGAPVPIQHLTTMTLGQFLQIYNQQIAGIQQKLTPIPPTSGPFTTTGIDVSKTGVELYPPTFPLSRSYQLSIGVQRDVGHGIVVTADYAMRRAINVSLGEVDLNNNNNYVNFVRTPVIPVCTQAQLFVPGQECSAGSITSWEDQGRARYNGLLVKVNKRFSHRYQFVASYALQQERSNSVIDTLHWLNNYGPVIPRHNLNVAGSVDLPWGFQLSLNSSIISRSPVNVSVPSLDLPGTAPSGSSEPLPGVPFECWNSGCGKSQLTAAVNAFNTTFAGTKNASGSTISPLILPPDYQLGDPTFSQDFRLTKRFTVKERFKFSVFGEMFNAFNIANLAGYSFSLDVKQANPALQTFGFGQPTQRAFQSFGSAGPRAVQVGGRITF